mgnify:CR=1 FL=1
MASGVGDHGVAGIQAGQDLDALAVTLAQERRILKADGHEFAVFVTQARGPVARGALVLIPGFDVRKPPALDAAAAKLGNTKLLGIEMYTRYLYPLQIAAVLLLVAIIAAIALTLRRRKDSKYVNPADQVRVTKADRLRIVPMKPTIEAPADGAAKAGDAA